ncbi:MAG: phosphomannomutase/phosphoglucomutase [Clostridiales bacterium]|nr:phosphomannomutase/phosphoglucomutase [Clostridiales bacterium]
MDYSIFKSGSDIRGYGLGDEDAKLYMSDEMISRCARAFCEWLMSKTGKDIVRISVGRDCRLSGERIENAVINALGFCRAEIIDCGLSSTPAMFMTTVELGCDGAVQITASHHPMDRNGLKFFTRDGGLDGSDIAFLLNSAQNYEPFEVKEAANVQHVDFMKTYSGILRKMIIDGVNASDAEHPLKGMKIVVDPGNGVGGFYARDVLAPLGADVSGSVFLEPDGSFPNHAPNPENAAAMQMASEACIAAGADLGIVFDTDVDRAAIVGRNGLEINRNRLVALACAVALKKEKGATIVTDSVTSDGLRDFITGLGGKHLRFKRGYRNVINKQIELCNAGVKCPLAMETSGHAAFAENYFLDDGAYLVTKLIIESAKRAAEGESLESMIASLEEPVEEKELRFKILAPDFRAEGEKIISVFEKAAADNPDWTMCDDNYEGVRINSKKSCGWFLIRLSVHDPIIVLNSESDITGGTRTMCEDVYRCIQTADNIELIDIFSLKEFLNK